MDKLAPLLSQRLRGRCHLAGLVRAPLDGARPRDDSLDHPRGTSTAREGIGCLFRECDRGGAAQRGAGSDARLANAWTGRAARGHTDGILQRKCRADAADPGSTGNRREAGRSPGGDTCSTPAARPGGKTTPPAPQAFARKHEAGPGPAQRYGPCPQSIAAPTATHRHRVGTAAAGVWKKWQLPWIMAG